MQKKAILFFIWFQCLFFSVVAQKPADKQKLQVIDSLKLALPKIQKDTLRARQYSLIAENYRRLQNDSALLYAEKSRVIFQAYPKSWGYAHAILQVASVQKDKRNYDLSLKNFQVALPIFEILKDQKYIGYVYSGFGNAYYGKNDYKKAIEYSSKGLDLLEKVKDYFVAANTANDLSICYKNLGNYPKSVEYSMKAIKYYENLGSSQQMNVAMTSANLGITLRRQGNHEQAIQYIKNAIEIYQTLGDSIATARTKSNLADVYKLVKRENEALGLYQEALRTFTQRNEKFYIGMVLNNQSTIFENRKDFIFAQQNYEKALAIFRELNSPSAVSEVANHLAYVYLQQQQPQKALELTKEAWEIAKKRNEKPMLRDIALNISLAHAQLNDFAKAYEYQQIYSAYKDSIFSKENTDAIAQMQEIYASEKKEQENRLLRNENELKASQLTQQRLLAEESKLLVAKGRAENALLQQEKTLHLIEIEKKQLADAQKQSQITLLQQEKSLQANALKIQEQELEQHQTQQRVAFAIGLLVLAIIGILYRNNRQKQKTNLVLTTQKQEITLKNTELEQQKEEILAIADNLRQTNEVVEEQKNELENTLQVVQTQKHEIEEINKNVEASIKYAQRIQSAMLPFEERIANGLGKDNFFILFRPRDIVSGDFYWFHKVVSGEQVVVGSENLQATNKNKSLPTTYSLLTTNCIFAVADCTGHGVPGAFMSMVGMNILDEIVIAKAITQPDKILTELHRNIRYSLKQAETEVRDGMDIVVLNIEKNYFVPENQVVKQEITENFEPNEQYLNHCKVLYAGAMNPLFYVQNQQLTEIKATKKPIGGGSLGDIGDRVFELHEVKSPPSISPLTPKGGIAPPNPPQRGGLKTPPLGVGGLGIFYLCTDGFQDQFGGKQNRKFMSKRMKELLQNIAEESMPKQKEILDQTITDWIAEGNEHQTDDITVVGIRL